MFPAADAQAWRNQASHDIMNPLMPLLIQARILASKLPPDLVHEAERLERRLKALQDAVQGVVGRLEYAPTDVLVR